MNVLENKIAARLQRRYARLVGRGTTALYVALRALHQQNGAGDIILPDLICSIVLDTVLLAGFTPVFADVIANRFTLDPISVRRSITAQTRAVIVAHLYGHVAETPDFGVPLIEDAVQGLGGMVGRSGAITFISFDDTKMIGGRGGVVLTDAPAWWEAIQAVDLCASLTPPNAAFQNYWPQLIAMRDRLIQPFDGSIENVERIEAGWQTLAENVRRRNEKAAWLSDALADLPLSQPGIRAGDAIWRYTFCTPTVVSANWSRRQLQIAGVRGSGLYPPLSALFGSAADLFSRTLQHRLINLWVDATTSEDDLRRAVEIIHRAPFD